jgi:AmmeMemoRadiSam system protein B
MPEEHRQRPRLRPVEALPVDHEGRRMVMIHDPAGLADGSLTIAEPALFILSLFDGDHTLADIQSAFAQQFGQKVLAEQLEDLVRQLDDAHYLEGPNFDQYRAGIVNAYKAAPARQTQPDAGLGVELHQIPTAVHEILNAAHTDGAPNGKLVGLVAPHLDLYRGASCYARAYGLLQRANPAARFIILGTNHFGTSSAVVATRKDFETPLGVAAADRDFIDRLSRRCGHDLCENEYDHQREHSIEIQVLFLQTALYGRPLRIVPVLCPDPCGPTGTAPYDGKGVDLADFAAALADELRDDATPTCIIAGADLSHIGRRFGDDRDLAEPFLTQVADHDRAALKHVEAADPEGFRRTLADAGNPTRVCSVGSIFTLLTALNRLHGPGRLDVRTLRYHQAVDNDAHTGVTCAAVAFTLKE